MRTKLEIRDEIAQLRALKPVGVWANKTQRSIDAAIEELEDGFDQTSDEFADLSESQKEIIRAANEWKEGDSDEKPSEGWGSLVE